MALMTTRDVSEELGVSPKTIQRMVARGELKAYKVGKSIRFRPEDVHIAIQPLQTNHVNAIIAGPSEVEANR